eukprot:4176140-Prymnesium_polylepis.1
MPRVGWHRRLINVLTAGGSLLGMLKPPSTSRWELARVCDLCAGVLCKERDVSRGAEERCHPMIVSGTRP